MSGVGAERTAEIAARVEAFVRQVFREIRAFRIYDGPTKVHKWSLAKKIKRDWKDAHP